MKNGHLKININDKIQRDFYNRETLVVAKELLGKILVHEVDGKRLMAEIVEVEAYLGAEDKGAHTYAGKRTSRTEIMYGDPGYSYVYFTYGMHNLFNVVTREKEVAQAVLIRAVDPISEINQFALNRFKKDYENLSNYQKKNLTNGPAKLTKAMNIDKSCYGLDLTGNKLYILNGRKISNMNIVETKRIGIDYAEEAVDFMYRFYIDGNKNVSKL